MTLIDDGLHLSDCDRKNPAQTLKYQLIQTLVQKIEGTIEQFNWDPYLVFRVRYPGPKLGAINWSHSTLK